MRVRNSNLKKRARARALLFPGSLFSFFNNLKSRKSIRKKINAFETYTEPKRCTLKKSRLSISLLFYELQALNFISKFRFRR